MKQEALRGDFGFFFPCAACCCFPSRYANPPFPRAFPLLAARRALPPRRFGSGLFSAAGRRGGLADRCDPARVLEVAGLDTAKLDYAFEYASRSSQHGGLLVVRHGWLAYERYFGRGNREATPAMASCGKALVSLGCGIMLEERRDLFPEGLDQKVFTPKFLPEAFPLDDSRKGDIVLGQLLSMAAGFHGDGGNPGFVNLEPSVKLQPAPRLGLGQDLDAIRTPLWTSPGGGYSYASTSPHVASIVLRHAVGMELRDYLDARLAKPMGWGAWGYAGPGPHTPGGGNCAIRPTDVLRLEYMLLRHGRWGSRQLVPAAYVEACGQPSPYQTHAPFSLMFEVNAEKHVAGQPRATPISNRARAGSASPSSPPSIW